MRFLYCLTAGLALRFSAQAQLGLRVGTTFAGQVAAPLTHLVGGSSLATSSRAGYQLGLAYQVPLGPHWRVVPELLFSRERQQVHVQGGGPDAVFQATYDLTNSYLNLPVLLRRQLGRVYLEAGPQGSWLVGGRGEGMRSYANLQGTVFYNLIDQAATASYSRLDAGLCLGVGVRVVDRLGVNVRLYQGFVGRNHDDSSSPTYLPKGSEQAYRQTLQLQLTYEVARP